MENAKLLRTHRLYARQEKQDSDSFGDGIGMTYNSSLVRQ